MSLIEMSIIFALVMVNVIMSCKQSHKEGYDKGELEGAEKMWNELCK